MWMDARNIFNIIPIKQQMLPYANPTQFLSLSYRNGIYQGYFNRYNQQRDGYGLLYTTDNNMLMGSTWKKNSCNSATFIFYNHAHYLYGFWEESIPHGFNVVRIGLVVIYAWYDMGTVQGRILILYQQYNTAIVLEQGTNDGELVQVQKGDIYSDSDLNQYIKLCQWPQFEESWKTLIKFISNYLINEKVPKPERTKLLLLNQMYFRYGYDEGIAIVFDDEYKILSMGLHQKANLKSLGIRFTKQNFVEEGNFNTEKQVFAFNYGQRPEHKIGKLYSNFLLKSVQFVSEYLGNPGKQLFGYWQEVIKSNLFRKLLAGQITTRKLDLSYQSPQRKMRAPSDRSNPDQMKPPPPSTTLQQYAANRKQEDYRQIQQEKMRLQAYKKQIYDSIKKRNKTKEEDQIEIVGDLEKSKREPIIKIDEREKVSQIIRKQPVDITTRTSRKMQLIDNTKSKYRSPIFTPEKNQSQNLSISPFKQKMRSKIFTQEDEQNRGKRQPRKKYVYQPDESDLYPRHTEANLNKYNSPHEQLDYSRAKGNDNFQVVPLSMKRDLEEEGRKSKSILRSSLKASTPTKEKKVEFKEEQYRKSAKIEKVDPTISFRSPYEDNEPNKQYRNTGSPNIVINSPYKKRSPAHRKTAELEIQAPQFAKQRNYNIEGLNNRKNNVYLNEGKKLASESPNLKTKKQIKGMTYLEKYKNKNPTPEKSQPDFSESRKYNKTIKSFNENNKIYEKVQSPPKLETRMKPQRIQIKPERTQIKPERIQRVQRFEDPKQLKREINEVTPTKKKYQYVFN